MFRRCFTTTGAMCCFGFSPALALAWTVLGSSGTVRSTVGDVNSGKKNPTCATVTYACCRLKNGEGRGPALARAANQFVYVCISRAVSVIQTGAFGVQLVPLMDPVVFRICLDPLCFIAFPRAPDSLLHLNNNRVRRPHRGLRALAENEFFAFL